MSNQFKLKIKINKLKFFKKMKIDKVHHNYKISLRIKAINMLYQIKLLIYKDHYNKFQLNIKNNKKNMKML